jgi:2-dehydropantoate 2-reductase
VTRPSRVAVLGAGANGSSIGLDLVQAGVDVTLVEQWPAHVEAIRSAGLTVIEPTGTRTVRPRAVHLCEVAEMRHPFDVVLIVMKAYDTRWAAELISSVLAPDGVAAAVQNGLTTDAVSAAVGAQRTVGCVIEVSATMSDPGIVRRHTPPERSWFAVDSDARGDRVAALLEHAGTVTRFDDIASAKWMKLVSNASVLVPTALLGLPMLDAAGIPGMRDAMIAAGEEALAVGQARGHELLPIFGLGPEDIAEAGEVVERMLDILYDRFVVPGATTTVLQDWGKGRRSEAEDINGLVSSEGARLGVATPVNDEVVRLARAVERGEIQPGPEWARTLAPAR